jgi:hypothetical protein
VHRLGTFPSMSRPAHVRNPVLLGLLLGLAAAACSNNNPKLMVTGLDPDHGDIEGGSYVRIKGNRFTADGPRAAKIYFGGRQGTVVRFESDTELIVQAPGGKPNEVVDVLIIFDPGGQLKIPNGFRFQEKAGAGPSVEDLNINKKK